MGKMSNDSQWSPPVINPKYFLLFLLKTQLKIEKINAKYINA